MRWTAGILLLGLWAGGAGGRVWVWQGGCNQQWDGVCEIGTCGGGLTEYMNNWGETACGEMPPLPADTDIVYLGSGAVVHSPAGGVQVAGVIVDAGAVLYVDGHLAAGRLEVRQGGTLYWNDGDLAVDTVENRGTFEINLLNDRDFVGTVENFGLLELDAAGAPHLTETAFLKIHPEGEFVLKRGAFWCYGTVENQGLILKTTPDTVQWACSLLEQADAGSVRVAEGLLEIYSSTFTPRITGSWWVDTAATLRMLSVAVPHRDTVQFQGFGAVNLEGNLTVPDSTLMISDLQEPGAFFWNSGDITLGEGSVWRNAGLFEAPYTPASHDFTGRFENYGTFYGTCNFGSGTVFLNAPEALLAFTQDGDGFSGPDTAQALVINQGTLRKSGTGTAHLDRLLFRQEGVCEVLEGRLDLYFGLFRQTAGKTRLLGSLSVPGFWMEVQHGVLSGSGTIEAPLRMYGDTLSPGDADTAVDTLTVQGPFLLDSLATLRIQVTRQDTQVFSDQVRVPGAWGQEVTLNHPVLVVELLNGYLPSAEGDSFAILTWAWGMPQTGTFRQIVLPNAPEQVRAWLTVNPAIYTMFLHLVDATGRLGDANNDGVVDARDVEYLAAYLYEKGPAPPVPGYADLNGDARVDDQDLVALTHQLWQAR